MKGAFGFLQPTWLLLLLLIPLAVLWIFWEQRRYWRDAFAFSQVSLLQKLNRVRHPLLRQRVLPLLLVLLLAVSIVGLAQPVLRTKVASENSYLMLVLDISISMEATDIAPNRLEAAKTAATEFIRELPDNIKAGLTFFSGNTYLLSPPVADHQVLIRYLDSLKKEDLRPGTAIGDAMLTGIESLQTAVSQAESPTKKAPPVGTALILITDGESNLGISPVYAVEEALRQRVRVFTVGMGEESGAYVRDDIFTHLDEPMLRNIAQQTGGEYFRARSFQDFRRIYDRISEKALGLEEKRISLMPVCLALAALFSIGGLVWVVRSRQF